MILNENNCNLKAPIFIDMDGEYCLNYLMYINQELLKIRKEDLISSLYDKYNINNSDKKETIAQKYMWVLNYINKYCEENSI